MEENSLSFRLRSTNNEYLITLKLLNDIEPQKIEISLTHKLKTGDINFLLLNSREELIEKYNFLSQFNSIKEIFDYFIKIIKSQNIKIIKPNNQCIFFYHIEFYDKEKENYLYVLIPKIEENDNNKIKYLEGIIEKKDKKIEDLNNEIYRISNINRINETIDKGKCIEVENKFDKSGLSALNNSQSINYVNQDKIIFKENNNNISFQNDPYNFSNEKIISDKNDECENFTAFTNMNQNSIIVWTIKRKGILNIYDFKKRLLTKQEAHSNNINCIQYFHEHNKKIDYIISLSKLDEDTLKIWKIDYEEQNKLICVKAFKKQLFKREVEIFCIFNYNEYDDNNSFLFIYGKYLNNKKINENNFNPDKNKEIICYKLNKELNNIIWGIDENEKYIHYKIIDNSYKINYLDTYYDFKQLKLYLINCNENNTEIIEKPFDDYEKKIFKYNDWNYYQSAFIKEVNNNLKLCQLSINGIVIWDIKKKEVEAFKYFENICLYDFVSWNDNYLVSLSDENIFILKMDGGNIEIKNNKEKKKGYSKIRKIITPGSYGIIVAIDDHKIKYWSS